PPVNQRQIHQTSVIQPPAYQAPAYQAPAPQTQGLGSLLSNTVANPKGELKAITTRSDTSYDGPQVPPPTSSLPKVVKNEPEVTKDTVPPTNNGSTIQPHVPNSEPVVAPVSASMPNLKPSIPYPSRRNDERRR
ncbi:hypothetical protein Tco_0350627, partial [Tanacetum coccineum]